MYILFILAMIVAAFGGPLIGASGHAEQSRALVSSAHTRVLADGALQQHRGTLLWAEHEASKATDPTVTIKTDTLTFEDGVFPEPWHVYGTASGREIDGSLVGEYFESVVHPTARVVVTFARAADDDATNPFAGAYGRDYDRRGVLDRLATRADAAAFVGIVTPTTSGQGYKTRFRSRDFASTFGERGGGTSAITCKATDHPIGVCGQYADRVLTSLKRRTQTGSPVSRGIPFSHVTDAGRDAFPVGTVVMATQF